MPNEWENQVDTLRQNGFTDQEIYNEQLNIRAKMESDGFLSPEIDEYFGIKKPDMAPMKKYIEDNYNERKVKEPTTNPIEAFVAGLEESSGGLLVRQKLPDMEVPADASRFSRIAHMAGSVAGDIPIMVAGALGGAAVGSAAGPVGTFVGATGTPFAAPTFVREFLMDKYEKGEIASSEEFWDRTAAIALETGKSFALGVATGGVGKYVKAFAPIANPVGKATAATASEIATLTTVGAALQGRLPEPDEFIDNSILIFGFHGAQKGAAKLRQIYAKTGLRPHEVQLEMENNPTIKQDLLSENVDIPEGLRQYSEVPKEGVVPEPKLPEPKEMSPAEKEIFGMIKEGEAGGPPSTLKEKAKTAYLETYQDLVDKYDPIKVIQEQLPKFEEGLTTKDNPYELMRTQSGYKGLAAYALQKGTIDYETRADTGKGFTEVTKPIRESGLQDKFITYNLAKRLVEKYEQGRKTGTELEQKRIDAAKKVIEENPQFEGIKNELVEFENRNLKYLRDSGVISDADFNNFVELNKSYLPIARIFDDVAQKDMPKSKAGFLKKFMGSDRNIVDPIQTLIQNTEVLFKKAEINRAVGKLLELDPDGKFFKKINQTREINITKEELANHFREQGIELTEAELNKMSDISIYRKFKKTALRPNEFEYFNKGKSEIYEVPDINGVKGERIAEAIKVLDGSPSVQSLYMKIASAVTSTGKIGITIVPDFALRNLWDDQLLATTYSKTGKLPLLDIFSAVRSILKKDEQYWASLKSGGAHASFIELGNKKFYKDIWKNAEETGYLDKAWNVITTPTDYLAAWGTLLENATRLAEGKRVRKGETSGEKLFQSGMAEREISLDFQRMGLKMQALNATRMFLNVGVQGTDKFVRAFKEDPAGLTTKGLAVITAPTIVLWYLNKDDERYKEVSDVNKALYWHFIFNDWQKVEDLKELAGLPDYLKRQNEKGEWEIDRGIHWKLPKPRAMGMLFGTMPERILDSIYKENPDSMKGLGEAIGGLISTPIVPDWSRPFVEQGLNKVLYNKKPIVNKALEGLLPEDRYMPYTSETAKTIGKYLVEVPYLGKLGPEEAPIAAPAVIDNYIRSWTGAGGTYLIKLLDEALYASGYAKDLRPAQKLEDMPFIKSFIERHPSFGAKSIQDFYDNYSHYSQILNSLKRKGSQGDIDRVDAIILKYQDKILNLEGPKEALTNSLSALQKIQADGSLPKDEKRQQMDSIYYMMINIAREANMVVEQIKKETKDSKK